MTAIVALAENGTVYIASDTLTAVDDRPVTVSKVVTLDVFCSDVGGQQGYVGKAAVGIAGDGALAAILRAGAGDCLGVTPPTGPDDDDRWTEDLARRITELGVAEGLTDEDNSGRLDAGMLLGWRGRLWTLSHGQSIPLPGGIGAAGCAGHLALGALEGIRAFSSYEPLDAVRGACAIACRYSIYAAEPVEVGFFESPPA